MAITPINNAMIQRTADVNMVKHQEEVKPMVDQQNIQVKVDQREDMLNHQVLNPENSDKTKNDQDAKDEGRGQKYNSKATRGKGKASDKVVKKDRVIKKGDAGGFDMKV